MEWIWREKKIPDRDFTAYPFGNFNNKIKYTLRCDFVILWKKRYLFINILVVPFEAIALRYNLYFYL